MQAKNQTKHKNKNEKPSITFAHGVLTQQRKSNWHMPFSISKGEGSTLPFTLAWPWFLPAQRVWQTGCDAVVLQRLCSVTRECTRVFQMLAIGVLHSKTRHACLENVSPCWELGCSIGGSTGEHSSDSSNLRTRWVRLLRCPAQLTLQTLKPTFMCGCEEEHPAKAAGSWKMVTNYSLQPLSDVTGGSLERSSRPWPLLLLILVGLPALSVFLYVMTRKLPLKC